MAKTSLPPGFRFHPTDIELTVYYLKRKLLGKHIRCNSITDIDLYKFAPWDLPEKASLKSNDLVWYFFCPLDRKYSSGVRSNRSTGIGYWKATGKDRPVIYNSRIAGMKRTLVFHLGKPPRGDRTDWVMYEYRLEDKDLAACGVKLPVPSLGKGGGVVIGLASHQLILAILMEMKPTRQLFTVPMEKNTDEKPEKDACVLCKIFQKSGPGPKIGAQYGAPFNEADWNDCNMEYSSCVPSVTPCPPESSHDGLYSAGHHLAVCNDDNVSLGLVSESNGSANHVQVCPNKAPNIPFDSIHLHLLAEIISCPSMNPLCTADEDGSQAGSAPDIDSNDRISLDGSETIFNGLDDLSP